VQIKAIACELPATLGVPLSRLSTADIVREAQRAGLVATISATTVWRWLHEDAIRPWQHRTWIFPRDPAFAVTEVETRPLHFQDYYESIATPFEGKFTRDNLAELPKKLDAGPTSLRPAA